MPPMTDQNGREYWRSLEEMADTPEFREFVYNEFPAGALDAIDSAGRRHFLKLMGASMALAGLGLAGCRRWPKEHIVPLANRPDDRIPGVAETYASTREFRGVGMGVLVVSSDGRPTKIEGNPLHPDSRGATDAFTQAGILDMYDPDRSRSVRHNGAAATWAEFAAWSDQQFGRLRGSEGGSGVYILSEATHSPSVLRMRERLRNAMPSAKWLEYEAISEDAELEGTRMAVGKPCRALYDFTKAQVVVSLDSDFLLTHPASVSLTRDWASMRVPAGRNGTMSRLYVAEGVLSLTGANADARLAVKSRDIAGLAGKIAARLLSSETFAQHASAGSDAAAVNAWVTHVVSDLQAHHGESLVIAGPRQPAEVHALAHLLNEALGNVGETVRYVAVPELDRATHAQSIATLADDLDSGLVKTLVMLGTNPVYTAPADVDFGNKLTKANAVIHLSDYFDETSSHSNCHWHLNRAHFLEAWGDARGYDGTYSITQPLILPLFDGKTPVEVLAVIAGGEPMSAYEITRDTFFANAGGANDEKFWRSIVHDGVLPESAWPIEASVQSQMSAAELAGRIAPMGRGDAARVELVFTPSSSVFDGRLANNGWLQELPGPITKLTWDNAALMSPAMGARFDVANGQVVRLTRGSSSVEAPALLIPGMADGTIELALGYGRETGGRIFVGAGVNAYPLRTTDALGFANDVTLTKTGGTVKLATTQDHHSMSAEGVGGKGVQTRLPTIFREGNLDEYREHPDFAKHRTHIVHRLNLWNTDLLEGAEYAWAMTIDLSTCTGCSACVVACQAENNIPIVGKDQVLRGREMHWIRIDRYFRFGKTDGSYDTNDVQAVALQPVTCMHCENAPCEQVCPVAATVHDKQGLNVMVYNRCVGTRYCSNNCPYKVRRFNYYDFHVRKPHRAQPGMLLQVDTDYYMKQQAQAEPLKQMQFNPEVTVRSRGVMEKCTYCVQRIEKEKVKAKNTWVKQTEDEKRANPRVTVPDGSVVPACAQACPANAIVFGDRNDSGSRVAQLLKADRAYELLEELNTRPRTQYLAKLRNPANGAHGGSLDSGEAH
jgi:MoCo/4Fe-4S cofactor protein with predicted Tat translocation signal